MMLANLSVVGPGHDAGQPSDGGDPISEKSAQKLLTPELRAMSKFVSLSNDIAYATLLMPTPRAYRLGEFEPDAFLQRELERAYQASREGRVYSGHP